MADPTAPAPINPDQNQPADPSHADPEVPAPEQPAPEGPAPNQPTPAVPVPHPPVPNKPALMQHALAAPQIIHQQVLNWSHFKPEFAGRSEEDAEVHLLHTNDWMINHYFPNDVKVQRFCLMLVGEARLWYESLTPLANNWPALQ